MYLWNSPSSEAPVINFTYERKLQIMNEAGDFFDFPDYWFEALAYNLAKRLMLKFGGLPPDGRQEVKEMALESLDTALAFDNAVYPLVMDMEQYG